MRKGVWAVLLVLLSLLVLSVSAETDTDFATPMDYGAVGDGIADDTEAVQACLDANSAVRLPLGKIFRITKTLEIKRTDVCLFGDNAQYRINGSLATLEGVSDHVRQLRLDNLKNSMSILYADLQEDGPAILVYRYDEVPDGPLRVTIRDLMIFGNQYSCNLEPGGDFEETVGEMSVGGIDAHTGSNITRCGFVGLSGTAVTIRSQHVELCDLSFFKCRTAVEHDSFDHIFRNLWISRCRDGLVSVYTSCNQKYQLDGIWFDQLLGDATRWARMQTVLVSDCWCDLIGGRFLSMPTVPKSESEELRGFIRGTRINRTNQITNEPEDYADAYRLPDGDASVVAGSTSQFYAQVSSEETEHAGAVIRPVFGFRIDCTNSMLIVPGREQVLLGAGTGNEIFGASGSIQPTGGQNIKAWLYRSLTNLRFMFG